MKRQILLFVFPVSLFCFIRLLPTVFPAVGFFVFLSAMAALFFVKSRLPKGAFAAAMLCLFAFFLSACFNSCAGRRFSRFAGQKLTLTGKIAEVFTEGDNRFSYLIYPKTEAGERVGGVILYGFGDFAYQKGEQITVLAALEQTLPTDAQKGKGAVVTGLIVEEKLLLPPSFLQQKLNDLYNRTKINILLNIPGEEGRIFTKMLLGEDAVSPQTENLFRLSGISHLLCISGLHMALLGRLFEVFLSLFFGKRPIKTLLSCLLLLCYLAVIGFPPAAVRAYLLLVFSVVGRLTYRRENKAAMLCLGISLMLAAAPSLAFNLSFLLSACSITALTLLSSKLLYRKARRLKGVCSAVAASAAATIGVLPVSAAFFGYFPALGAIASLFTVPLMPAALIFGLLSVLLGGSAVGAAMGKICAGVIFCIEWFGAQFSGWLLPLRDGFVLLGLGTAALILLLSLKTKRKRLSAFMAAFLFAAGLAFGGMAEKTTRGVRLLGENSFSVLLYKGREGVLVGMGEGMEETATAYLRGHGITKIQALILPTGSKAVSQDCYAFCENNRVERLIALPNDRWAYSAQKLVGEIIPFTPGSYRLFCGKATARLYQSGGTLAVTLPSGEAITFVPEGTRVSYENEKTVFYLGG